MSIPGQGTECERSRGSEANLKEAHCGWRWEFEKRQGGLAEVGAGAGGTACPAEEPTLPGSWGTSWKVPIEVRWSRCGFGKSSLAAAGSVAGAAGRGSRHGSANALEASVGPGERGRQPGQEQGLCKLCVYLGGRGRGWAEASGWTTWRGGAS